MTNEEIARCVRKAQDGCHESFKQLIAHHESKIREIIWGSLRNYRKEDKEDMYQEVLLHTWRNIKSKNEAAHFTAWLIVLTKWRCAAMKRKRLQPMGYDFRAQNFEKEHDWHRISFVFFMHEKSFMDLILTREAIDYVRYVVSGLSIRDKHMLISEFWWGKTLIEQGKRLGVSRNICYKRRKEAKENFRQALLEMAAPEDLCELP